LGEAGSGKGRPNDFTGEGDLNFSSSGLGGDWVASSKNLDILFTSSFLGDTGSSMGSSAGFAGDLCPFVAIAEVWSWTFFGESKGVLIGEDSTNSILFPAVLSCSTTGVFLEESTRDMTSPPGRGVSSAAAFSAPRSGRI
jgi:hypothetical protein